ncbi:MAG: TonB-dependent receptor [Nitrospirota bacterium]
MKKIKNRTLFFSLLLLLFIPSFTHTVYADICDEWIARTVSVQGDVQVRRIGEAEWQPAKLDDTYCPGDMIRVLDKSRVAVVLVNGVILRLDQHSSVIFNGIEAGQTSLIDMLKGVVQFFSRWPRSLKVHTPFVNSTVEGTEFLVRVEDDRTFVSIFEGKVIAENEAGRISLRSGQSAISERGKAPMLVVVVKPRDVVQWALYYPPVLYEYEKLEEGDPRFYTQQASLLLSVGRVEEAKAEIEKALSLDVNYGQAIALQSIINVVQNEKEKALELAKKAVEADPQSAATWIALSYAQQARFALEGALESIKEAVRVEPENALVWARMAELRMAFGALDDALHAASRAMELNPDISRTQTVLGFTYLAQVKIKEAKDAFQKAIELDQADPLARLGLGLAKIREGCLEEGRREIEIAVSLDPDNSLIRSYLGKAYFEEKQDKMAEDQYGMAEEFDPKDPTPYFYDAIRKQTINRPVEALHDMQKAIELNDNRAVYRSKLLLDSDLAARSASLSRIYTDLGFEQLVLVEGWKSVNIDPADFSGHRFLADTYSALPRHEIARVSELLQSQLLQPINITPVQPHLAESNLFILEGAGPAELSFNEFNPLFNRNRYSLQLSGIAGENSTFGDEIVVAAVKGKASISAGQFHYETDGWRENNDQKQDIYNLFAQVELTPETSIQAEFRARDFDRGDLTLFFGKDNFIPTLREDKEERTLRFGFHHSFSPASDILGSFIYNTWDGGLHYIPADPVTKGFGIESDNVESYSGELQHLLNSKYIKLVSGIGYFNIDQEDEVTLELLIPDGPPFPIKVTDVTDLDTRHTNLYFYSHINYPKNVTFTIGGSGDFYDGADTDEDQFNPKFGVTWNPLPATTLRAAAFRTLKRTLTTNQTLEPTQVAGFNQFYDDFDATDSWRYGMAIDQKFSKNIYGGVEYSQRDLEFPTFVVSEGSPVPELIKLDRKERVGRAYLYWTPHQWIAISTEYHYEKMEIEEEILVGDFEFLRTNRFPMAVTFSHPSGFTARVKTTYIDQEGKFKPQGAPVGFVVDGADNFWLFDASVSYRLPKRFGIIMIDARNLFDQHFQYHDVDVVSPSIQSGRAVFAKFTLAF